MKRSDHLFQLVKSLSKSEKRSFKLYAKRHTIGGKNNYILLFDAIDRQDEYDEIDLIKKIKEKKLIDNLSSIKVQLYNLILKCLRQNNTSHKAIYEIRMYMDYIDIFFEKGLYDQSKKMLKKAYDLAYKFDMNIIIDNLSIYEFDIAIKESNYEDIQNYIDVTYPEVKRVRKNNENLAEYEYLMANMKLLVLKSNRTGLTIDKDKFENLMTHELLQTPSEDQEFYGQIDFHTIWGYYHTIMGNRDKAYYNRKKVLELMESRPEDMEEQTNIWIYNARLLLVTLGRFRMYQEFDEEQEKIKKVIENISRTKKTRNLEAEIYNTIYNTKIDNDIDRGFFKEGSIYAQEAENHFKTYENQIDLNSKMVLYCNFSYVYFGNEEYSRSLVWVNRLLNDNYGKVRIDLQCMGRIMNIAIHYSLGNFDLILSLIRSTDRFLVKNERKFKIETSFLRFARKSLQSKYQKELKESFDEEIRELIEIAKDPIENKTMAYFDLISWLRSVVEGRSMEEIIGEATKKEKLKTGVL